MSHQTLLIILTAAIIFCGLLFWRRHKNKNVTNSISITNDYFLGLNYLINEQPDKAVDVFIKMLEVNTDTVETHLALGSLFRRRGEVDRAIRVHQNLIARPYLEKKQRIQALFELAQDYLRAGVLDRAERLFLDLLKQEGEIINSLNGLINIYQQQKDWRQAIAVTNKLQKLNKDDNNNNIAIAHYYCELAQQYLQIDQTQKANECIEKALEQDRNCARANIILGRLFIAQNQYQKAILAFQYVYKQDNSYISEIIADLSSCYQKLDKEDEYITYLQQQLKHNKCIYFIFAMTDYIANKKGNKAAIEYLIKYIQPRNSLAILKRLFDIYSASNDTQEINEILINKLLSLKEIIDNVIEYHYFYKCIHCGFTSKQLYWQCPSCRHWNSIKPMDIISLS